MARILCAFAVLALGAAIEDCAHPDHSISEPELARRTQALFDSVAAGDRGPWQRYFASDSIYFDEKGRNMDNKALVADVTPLPQGYFGSIKLARYQSRIFPDTAIFSYDLDETETVFGQKMTARYHGTDTWVRRNGDWQIVAGQMLRYYEDPAPGRLDAKRILDYPGTYELVPGKALVVSVKSGSILVQKTGRPAETLIPEAGDIFFRKGVEGREVFRRDERGRVDALLDRRNNEDVLWRRVN
ncbi:MAG TPA: DUF4440 domain-containing protein [Bryobacteraceae bacterium]|nr:DUF4440 domain-containing protein [Bryobacteraceae bacterium]